MPIHSQFRAGGPGMPGRDALRHAVDSRALMPDFIRLVDETVAQVDACPARPDPTFEGYGELVTAIRSATTLEGTLLEKGIARVAACNSDLVQIGLSRPLPVHEAAKAVFQRNDWARASGLRLDSEVAAREHYRPDLLLVDRAESRALILDIKRAVASCKPRDLADLQCRMMAAALVTRDRLERDHDAPPVGRVDVAIVDGSGESRDEAKGILALGDLDWMLRLEGAADAMLDLRNLYGQRVRALLAGRCRAIVALHRTPQVAPGGRQGGGDRDHPYGGWQPDGMARRFREGDAPGARTSEYACRCEEPGFGPRDRRSPARAEDRHDLAGGGSAGSESSPSFLASAFPFRREPAPRVIVGIAGQGRRA